MTQKWELEHSEIGSYLLCVFYFFFNLFLATLGLLCCRRALSSCGKPGLLSIAARRLLVAVGALLVEHRL